MTDELDEALEARLRHFLRGVSAADTMRTAEACEQWRRAAFENTIRDIRKLCDESKRGPAKYRVRKSHLGLLNGDSLPGKGHGNGPELRLVE